MIKDALKSAEEINKELELPEYGRSSPSRDYTFKKLEKLYREILYPYIPSYDVKPVQSSNFDEYAYYDAPNFFWATTQSLEINTRLLIEASDYSTNIINHHSLFNGIKDKWKPEIINHNYKELENKVNVFFPPGGNISYLINEDYIRRVFNNDDTWRLKPHPISEERYLVHLKYLVGLSKMFHATESGQLLFHVANTIGYTTASEFGLLAIVNHKKKVDFSLYTEEHKGNYYPIYRSIRDRNSSLSEAVVFNRLLSCPYSGLIPINISTDEAKDRLIQFKEKTLELRAKWKPLIPHFMNYHRVRTKED